MTISVVIPALDEASGIADAVRSVVRSSEADSGAGAQEVEVLVVDGGSLDETCRLAREAGAQVFVLGGIPGGSFKESFSGSSCERHHEEAGEKADESSETNRPGRARQLRLGGERSKGEVILFLHADTQLEAGWREAVERVLADPGCAGGAFAFRLAERGVRERWIEAWVAVRVALLGLPYGDQALFMRRSVLERMGGVPIVPMMEDLDLVRAIKRAGRMEQLALRATTSSRRYRERGTLKTLLWHQVALLGWFLGWDRSRLAQRMGR